MVSDEIFSHAKLAKPGYFDPSVQETAEAGSGPTAPPVAPIAKRLARADVKKGEDTKPCQTWHTFAKGTGPKIGPPLYGVVERAKGSVEGFDSSEAIRSKGGIWTFDDLDQFHANPRAYAGHEKGLCGRERPRQTGRHHRLLAHIVGQPRALAGKMRVSSRVFARAEFLPRFFMLIWPKNSAAFAAARVCAT
ncbi:MAG: hypothetical protein M3178_16555 [Pseudomonadota bacterium]|nr:hypothetical protein [Pseudomonadota bacterium]